MPTPATVVRDVIAVLPKFTRWTVSYPWVIYGTPLLSQRRKAPQDGRIALLRYQPVALDAMREPPPRPRREARGCAAHGGAALPRSGLSRHHAQPRCRAAEHHQTRALQLFPRQ